MNIFVVGHNKGFEELKEKFSQNETVSLTHGLVKESISSKSDCIIDLDLDENPQNLSNYASLKGTLVLGGAVKAQLAEIATNCTESIDCLLVGLNTLPTFLNRRLWEISLFSEDNKADVIEKLGKIGVEVKSVKDRVGMVTPRIILMIINEAFYTVQEGTASKADINQAMKLGTNYPQGPFEWAEKIGIDHIYKTLKALQQDTGDTRYKICPLLKTEYLKSF